MIQKQKETILALLESNQFNENYRSNYWFSYKDFLDTEDGFTEFAGENFDGKQEYIVLIENLLNVDENAKIFVEVYGYEKDNDDEFIYADTLIIFSILPLFKIKQIFYESKNIFPSDVGEYTEFSHQNIIVGDKGNLLPTENLSNCGYSVYYCWWD